VKEAVLVNQAASFIGSHQLERRLHVGYGRSLGVCVQPLLRFQRSELSPISQRLMIEEDISLFIKCIVKWGYGAAQFRLKWGTA
jgi:hypothetical protein